MHWVEIPAIGLRMQCGCPPDANKYLRVAGFISQDLHGETGPNAILLADRIQAPCPQKNWVLPNAAEFPLMHIFYLQGWQIPGHPNNDGRKPLLIGQPDEIERQLQYLYYGNYGLDSIEAMQAAGMSYNEATAFWYAKQHFAFGKICPMHEWVRTIPLPDYQPVAIAENCYLQRIAPNHFALSYQEERIEIQLAIEVFPSAYSLPPVTLPDSSQNCILLHIGEGDGWDHTRPCMASALLFGNQYYLIDAGPNVWQNWERTGKTIHDVAGVILTHAHDDHAIGLIQALAYGVQLTVYCSNFVEAHFRQKMSMLLGVTFAELDQFFNFQRLQMHTWNTIASHHGALLEAMPCHSLHPIETHIYYFRHTDAAGREKTYGHLTDILSEKVMRQMEQHCPGEHRWLFDFVRKQYYLLADVKKIDIGGGASHGMAEDFAHDPTPVKIWGHLHRPLTGRELEIGQARHFGMWDVL